jgi:hypothetical protein
MTADLSGLKRPHCEIVSLTRAWASSTPPTCAVLDGQRTQTRWGTAGRLLSGVGGRAGQNNKNQIPTAEITERTATRTMARLASSDIFQSRGVLSWVNQKGILHSRRMKCGAMNCRVVQWIAPRQSRRASHALFGTGKQPRIGRITRAYSPAWRNIGYQAIEFQTRGAWRLSVCSHSPPITGEWSPSKHRKDDDLWPTGSDRRAYHNPRRILTTDRVGVATQ